MPRFSVIIPVYNVAPYLRECLDSVLAQTVHDWEAICVDDGSTDDSGAILDEYAANDIRFRIVHQRNAGVSAARQTGLDLVRGEYVGAVDPDDWVSPDYFERLIEVADWHRADMVFGGFTYEYENGICKVDPQLFACDVESQVRELLGGRLWGAMWMRLIKVEFILRYSIKYPKLRLQSREDTCFVAATLAKMPKIVRADTVGYHYRIRRSSLIH